jgi:hypothetical protein
MSQSAEASETFLQSSGSEVSITAPSDGSTVSGVIQIVGTVIDPAFLQYELAIAAAGTDWQDIQPPVSQQVQAAVLGLWSTSSVPDGSYQIRLRMMRQNGDVVDSIVTVNTLNATPTTTSTPTAQATPTSLEPSATVLIWQPPTRTPRPSATPGGPTPTPDSLTFEDSPFNPGKMGEAAWNGALVAVSAFGLLALYGIVRVAIRHELRASWQAFRRDYVNVILDAFRRRQD